MQLRNAARVIGFLSFSTICLISGAVFGQGTGYCLDSQFPFETSALEKIVHDPQGVLDQENAYWENEKAQVYTTEWGKNVHVKISRDEWRKQIAALSKMSAAERENIPLMQMTESIIAGKDEFMARAIPHICSFLPENVYLDVPVYFTAFIPPRSFVTGGVVINVAADYWKGNAENILNNLVHEIFHVGYSHLRQARSEPPLENWQLYEMLESLQNEGLATYVGYRAVPIFPAPDEIDYQKLAKPDDVMRALVAVNELFEQIGAVSEIELQSQSWRKGVTDRAYYIAGAHMAEVIDRERGTEALVRTITQGPVSFVRAYNALVPENRKIQFPSAETIEARQLSSQSSLAWYILPFVALGFLTIGVVVWRILRRQSKADAQVPDGGQPGRQA